MQSIPTFWRCDQAAIWKWETEGSILLQTQINVLPSARLPSDDGKQTVTLKYKEKLRKVYMITFWNSV